MENRIGTGKVNPRGQILIRDDSDPPCVLYGHQHLERIRALGEAEEVFVINGIQLESYVAFMQVHYPNHWASKALTETEIVTDEILRDISNEIELSVADARYLSRFQKWANEHGRGEE